MGKKRRLKSANAKFAHKHSAHPRARLLASQYTDEEETAVENTTTTEEPTATVEDKAIPPVRETTAPKLEAIAPTPKKAPRTKRTPAKKKTTTTRKSRAQKTTL